MVETNTNNEINSYQKQTPAATPGCQQGEATHSNDKTEYRQNEKNIVAYRPRILYSAIFVWNTVTCGKFIAPLLQELSPKFTDSVIGVTLSFQYGIVATLAGFGGSLADSIERRSSKWGHGRLLVLASSIMLGTLAFIGHALPGYLEYHEEASSIHFVSMSICAPALDGLTLAHLEIIKDGAQSEFGKERMYGAIFWGLGSLINGIGIDQFGFGFLYFMVIFSTVVSYMIIGLYLFGLNRDSTGVFTTRNNAGHLSTHSSDKSNHVSTKKICMMLCHTGYGVAFCFYLFVLSSGISVVDNLAFIFFNFLGSSDTTNGFSVIFAILMEIPCFHYAPELLQRYGPGQMLLIAGGAYVIRVLGYTLVPKGQMLWVLMLETLHGFTYACQKVGSVDYVARLMPKGYEASGQGILILISYFGVVVGLFVAGWMQEALGPRAMYGIMGFVVLLGMLVFVVVEKCSSNDNVTESLSTEQKDEQARLLKKTPVKDDSI